MKILKRIILSNLVIASITGIAACGVVIIRNLIDSCRKKHTIKLDRDSLMIPFNQQKFRQ